MAINNLQKTEIAKQMSKLRQGYDGHRHNLALEPRVMFDGAIVPLLLDSLAFNEHKAVSESDNSQHLNKNINTDTPHEISVQNGSTDHQSLFDKLVNTSINRDTLNNDIDQSKVNLEDLVKKEDSIVKIPEPTVISVDPITNQSMISSLIPSNGSTTELTYVDREHFLPSRGNDLADNTEEISTTNVISDQYVISSETSPEANGRINHLVIVDGNVSDTGILLNSMLTKLSGLDVTGIENLEDKLYSLGIKVAYLNAHEDGVTQISALIQEYQLDSLHLITHGGDGSIKLGSGWLNNNNIDEYGPTLENLQTSFKNNADVFIYGCNVAKSDNGKEFVSNLSTLLGVDVAASTDNTGSGILESNWDLEFELGNISQIQLLSSALVIPYDHVLASNDAAALHYLTPDAYDISNPVFESNFNVSGSEPTPLGLTFSLDGRKMFAIGQTRDSVVEYDLSTPFDVSTASYVNFKLLRPDDGAPYKVEFSSSGDKMFVLGAATNNVFQYDLSTSYDVSTAILEDSYGIGQNVVGMDISADGSMLFTIDNVNDEVVGYQLSTAFDLSTIAPTGQTYNVGLAEPSAFGIEFSADGRQMFIAGISSGEIHEFELGINYDITSANHVQTWDVSSYERFPVDFTFDANGDNIYVIGYFSGDVSMFDLNTTKTAFSETVANDGAVQGDFEILLTGDVFQDIDNDDLLDFGTEVNITNLPIGLTPIFSLSEGDTKLTLTFTGNAINNQDIHDIDSLVFEFNDAAFMNTAAINVVNATGPYDSGISIDFDDNPIIWSLTGDASVAEGNDASYTLSLGGASVASGIDESLNITLSNIDTTTTDYNNFLLAVDNAISGYTGNGGYTRSGNTITFTGNGSTAGDLIINLTTINDTYLEGDESFTVSLNNVVSASGATLSSSSSVVTTIEDEEFDRLVNGDIVSRLITSDANGTEGSDNASFLIRLYDNISNNVVRNFTGIDFAINASILGTGTAIGGGIDYSASSTFSIAGHGASGTFYSINIVDDTITELPETIDIQLNNTVGILGETLIADKDHNNLTLTIFDNEAPIAWSLTGDTSVLEGDNASYTLSLGSVDLGHGISESVDINLTDGSTDTNDYATFLTAVDNAITSYTGNGSYSISGNTITFTGDGNAAGDLIIQLGTQDDVLLEGDEDYTIALSNVSSSTGATLSTQSSVNTIIEDVELDNLQNNTLVTQITTTDNSGTEGSDDASFTISLVDTNPGGGLITNATGSTITIDTTISGTATGTDYTLGAFEIAEGDSSAVISVGVIDDSIVEIAETLDIQIKDTSISLGLLKADSALNTESVTIDDNDGGTIEWSLTGDTSVLEGDNASYTLSLGGVNLGHGISESVDINLTNGSTDTNDYATFLTAVDNAITSYTGNGSYSISGNTITFTGDGNAAGDLILQLGTQDDVLLEGDEDYTIALSNVGSSTGATLSTQSSVNTIIEDVELDNLQNNTLVTQITTTDNSGTEGSDDASFTISLVDTNPGGGLITNATGSTITIDTTISGTATATDYTLGAFEIAEGDSSAVISVGVIDDSIVEIAETLDVEIKDTSISLGLLKADSALNTESVTIDDNDGGTIEWSLTGDTSVLEGDNASYTLSLGSVDLGHGISESVDINLTNGSTDTNDYATFLTAVDNAITSYTGNGSYSISGNTITFTGDGNAAGDLIIQLGTQDDVLLEGDEDYTIALSNVSSSTGATLSTQSSVNTIIEDVELDNLQNNTLVTQITTTDNSGTEGSDDASFTISLVDTNPGGGLITNATGSTITIDTTISGTATGTDYTLGAFEIAEGDSSAVISVGVIDDSIVEIAETLDVEIKDTSISLGLLKADSALNTESVTIDDNDGGTIEWSLTGDTSVLEGDNASYTLSLGGVSLAHGLSESVDINLTNGSTENIDYDDFLTAVDNAITSYTGNGSYSISGNTITFTGDGNAAGDLIIQLGTQDDVLLEGDEDYTIALSNVSSSTGATLSTQSSVNTMIEDVELDNLQNNTLVTQITTTDNSGTEGSDDASFTISLVDTNPGGGLITNATGSTITIDTTISGTATGTDYTLGAFEIAEGDSSAVISVGVIDDSIVEIAETLDIQIKDTSISLGLLKADSALNTESVTIDDNDGGTIEWSLTGDASVLEGDNASYTLSLGGVSLGHGISESVDINLTNGSTDTNDYATFLTAVDNAITSYTGNGSYSISGNTITFTGDGNAAGDLIIQLGTQDDVLLEGDEDYTIALSNVSSSTGATLSTQSSVNTMIEDVELDNLQNNTLVTQITTTDNSGTEGSDDASFTISLVDTNPGGGLITNATGSTITIDTTISGTATGTDYTLGAFEIAEGDSSAVISVGVIDDSIVEIAETLDVEIKDTSISLGLLKADSALNTESVTIDDNDGGTIEWSLTGDASVLEGDNASYTLSLGGVSLGHGLSESVDISLTNGSTDTNDYATFLTAMDNAITSYTGNGSYSISGNTITFTGDGNAAGDLIIQLGTQDDVLLEGDEDYTIALSNVSSSTGATLSTQSSVNTMIEDVELDNLQNNALVTQITTTDNSGTEGSDDASFTISLVDTNPGGGLITNATGSTITIDTTISGTATGTDYTLGAFEIAEGDSSAVISVGVIDDSIVEIAETLDVEIKDTSISLGLLKADSALNTESVTIDDNDGGTIEWSLTGDASVLEGDNASYTLSLGGVSLAHGLSESVDINLTNGSTENIDYDDFLTAVDNAITSYTGNGSYSISGNTITFTGDGNAAGDLIIQLGTQDDVLLEGDEDYTIALSNVGSSTGATLSTQSSVNTMIEDVELDNLQNNTLVTQITTTDNSGTEGSDDASFTISLVDTNPGGGLITNATGSTITIDTTISGTATGTDYTLGAFEIAEGDSSAVISVGVIDDSIVEIAETLDVEIKDTSISLGLLKADSGLNTESVTIDDNDGGTIEWSLTGDASVLEGDNASYTLSLGGVNLAHGLSESVDINLTNGSTDTNDYATFLTAVDNAIISYTGNGSYSISGNTITFTGDGNAAGDLILQLGTQDDVLLEGDEDYTIALSNVGSSTGATLSTQSSVNTIIEDVELDNLQNNTLVTQITTTDNSGTEGSDDASFTISLVDTNPGGGLITNATGSTITIDTTISGTATATDYTLGAFEIAEGDSSAVISVGVIDDSIVEIAETLDVEIKDTSISLGLLKADSALNTESVTIDDNDGGTIEWSLTGDTSVLEGDNASYTLSLGGVSLAHGLSESVDINLTNGSTENIDYDDFLTAVDNAITSYTGNGSYSISGNTITFTGDGNAAGDLIIQLGTQDDVLLEGDEDYTIALSNVSSSTGATLSTQSSVNTMIEDVELDNLQNNTLVTQITTTDNSGTEGSDDASFTISLVDTNPGGGLITNATGSTITIDTTISGTATGTDYTLGAFEIAEGDSSAVISVGVIDDSIVEIAETLDIQIKDTSISLGLLKADSALNTESVTIDDNDGGTIEWSLTGDASVLEGDNASYTLSLGGVSLGHGISESVDINLTNGSTDTNDYATFLTAVDNAITSYTGNGSYSISGNTITFTGDGNAAGDLILQLGTQDDVLLEGDEDYTIALSNVGSSTGATLSTQSSVNTIIEDVELDNLQNNTLVTQITTTDNSGTEGSDDASFTISLVDTNPGGGLITNATGSTITIDTTISGTATATDYTLGAFEIAEGDSSAVISVGVIDDSIVEIAETLDVEIKDTSISLGLLKADSALNTESVTIDDNDGGTIEWSLTGDTSVLEGDNASYTLSLGGVSLAHGLSESVDINLTNGSTENIDYDDFLTAVDNAITSYTGNGSYSISGNTITFTGDGNAAGDLIIQLGTQDDVLLEGDEDYTIALSNVSSSTGATLSTQSSVNTIIEDVELDNLQNNTLVTQITTTDNSGTEGSDDASFTISLVDTNPGGGLITNATGSTITIDTTISGTATATDYTLGAFEIAEGDSSAVISVGVIDDSIVEIAETLDVEIKDTSISLGLLKADSALNTESVTIDDNDGGTIEWSLTGDASVLEGDNASYTLSLGGVSLGHGLSESVDISLTNGSTDTNDYATFLTAVDNAITSYTGNGSYSISGNTITFTGDGNAAGDLIIQLGTQDDVLLEGDEDYTIALSNVGSSTGATLSTQSSVNTMIEDVELDNLQNNALVTQITTTDNSGTEGSDDASFTISLVDTNPGGGLITNATGSTITIDTTISGTATGTDYTLGAFEIAEGDSSAVISVGVIDDSIVEIAETLDVEIKDTSISLGLLKADSALNTESVTIDDNDGGTIEWSLTGDASVLEGDNASYTLSLGGVNLGHGLSESVDINLTNGSTDTNDYATFLTAMDNAITSYTGNGSYSISGNTITFTGDGNAAGDLILQLGTQDDVLLEGDEDYTIALSNVGSSTGATLSTQSSVNTIIEDVELDNLQNNTLVTQITTTDNSGTEGSDDASFTISLVDTNPGGGLITNATGSTITIDTTISGTATGTDYTLGAFEIAEGDSSAVISVGVIDDSIVEIAETLDVEIKDTSISLGLLKADSALNTESVTIDDNDGGTIEWSLTGDTSVLEGDNASYTLSLGGVSLAHGLSESVDINLTNGSTDTNDYATFLTAVDNAIISYTGNGSYSISGNTITFTGDGNAAGDLILQLGTQDDVLLEGDEDYTIALSNVGSSTGATLSTQSSVNTIIEDVELDNLQNNTLVTQITTTDNSGTEGSDDASFTISLVDTNPGGGLITNATGSTITIDTTISGTATATDYTLGAFEIAEGDSSAVISVGVIDDSIVEIAETLDIQIKDTSISLGLLKADSALNTESVTIDDNDGGTIEWSLTGDTSVLEGDNASYTLSLGGVNLGHGISESVDINLTNGSTDTNDYATFLTAVDNAITSYTGNGSYSISGNTITFTGDGNAAGDLILQLGTQDDVLLEGDEDYTIALSNVGSSTGATLSTQSSVNTIIEDVELDNLQNNTLVTQITTTDNSGTEGSDDASFTISLVDTNPGGGLITNATGSTITIDTTISGTATGTDYTLGAFEIAEGDSSAVISVGVIDDSIVEIAETLDVEIKDTSISLGLLKADSALNTESVTIDDNDGGTIEWSLTGDTSVLEGDNASYTLSLGGVNLGHGISESVDINLTNGSTDTNDYATFLTAVDNAITSYTGNGSYSISGNTITFTGDGNAAGDLILQLGTQDDVLLEGDEDYTIALSNVGSSTGATLSTQSSVNTIIEDVELDNLQNNTLVTQITTTDNSGTEGSDDASFTISLVDTNPGGGLITNATGSTITIDTTISGTATATDYTLGAFEIAEGDSSAVISVGVIDDSIVEIAETLDVEIKDTSISLGLLKADSALNTESVTIDDNDGGTIEWSLTGDTSVLEGDNASYTLSLGGVSLGHGISESVDISLTNGSTDTNDYATFLTAVDNAITSYTGNGSYSISGNTITFTGDGNAAGDLIIQLGTQDDVLLEGDEDYTIALSNVSSSTGATLSTQSSVNTMIEDVELDNLQNNTLVTQITTTDNSGTEGSDDASFTISLVDTNPGGGLITNATGSTITIDTTISGTATGTDYTLGAFEIAEGDSSAVISVGVIDDSIVEIAETLDIQIKDTSISLGLLKADSALNTESVTIDDNDGGTIEWSLTGDASVLEGDNASYTLSLGGVSLAHGLSESVDISLTNGSTDTNDYATFLTAMDNAITSYTGNGSYSISGNTITFTGDGNAAGDLIIQLGTQDDVLLEGDEDYTIALSNVSSSTGATLSTQSSVNTIIEDVELDNLQNNTLVTQITTTDNSGTEGSDDASFTISLVDTNPGGGLITNATGSTITIDTTISGTATGTDYTLGAFEIAEGDSSAVISVGVIDDSIVEIAETLDVEIKDTSISLGLLKADSALNTESVTIDDNDGGTIEWSLTGDTSVLEGDNASYTLSLGGVNLAHGLSESVDINLTNGSTDTNDYATFLTAVDNAIISYTGNGSYSISGNTITFTGDGNAAGDLILQLGTQDDVLLEGDEDYTIALSNVSSSTGATLSTQSSVNTMIEDVELDNLQNNTLVTQITTTDNSGTEGSDDASFTISLVDTNPGGGLITNATGSTITIDTTISGTATGTDYTLGAFEIAEGDSSAVISVGVIDDSIVEIAETLDVEIKDTSISLGLLKADSALNTESVTIDDNDGGTIEWSLTGDASVLEGDNASYTLSLGGVNLGHGISESVDISLTNGSTENIDYDDFLTAVDNAITSYTGNGSYSISGNTITFTGDGNAAGDLIIQLGTQDDVLLEGDEDYTIALSNVGSSTGATLSTQSSVNTIIEDVELDNLQNNTLVTQITTTDNSGTEGSDDASFTISLVDTNPGGGLITNATGSTITIDTTISGTATGTDYTLGAFEIAEGDSSAVISVGVIDDSIVEIAETLDVEIKDTSISLGLLKADSALNTESVTIDDNDGGTIEWSLTGDASVLEGDNASYTLSLGGVNLGHGISESVDINLTNGSTENIDYDDFLTAVDNAITSYTGNGSYSISGNTITFTGDGNAAGDLILNLGTQDDVLLEGDEDYTIALSNVGSSTGATLSTQSSVNTIIEDNEAIRLNNGDIVSRILKVDPTSIEGGDSASFIVELYDKSTKSLVTNGTGRTITVSYSILPNSKASASDYTITSFDIADGANFVEVTVSALEDNLKESSETLRIQLEDTNILSGSILSPSTPHDKTTIILMDSSRSFDSGGLNEYQIGSEFIAINSDKNNGLKLDNAYYILGLNDDNYDQLIDHTVFGRVISFVEYSHVTGDNPFYETRNMDFGATFISDTINGRLDRIDAYYGIGENTELVRYRANNITDNIAGYNIGNADLSLNLIGRGLNDNSIASLYNFDSHPYRQIASENHSIAINDSINTLTRVAKESEILFTKNIIATKALDGIPQPTLEIIEDNLDSEEIIDFTNLSYQLNQQDSFSQQLDTLSKMLY